MAQLIMYWKNDGTKAVAPVFPEGIELVNYPSLENAMDEWLDIVRYMSSNGETVLYRSYYAKAMTNRENYSEDKCFFLTVNGKAAATITVICDYGKKEGYIHMVTCKPDYRGMGLGHMLNEVAIYTLKTEGMETAHLTTDDWRIPAIKTYLKAGLYPDTESQPDFKERWEAIYKIINN